MVDPTIAALATSVTGILVPYLVKGAEEFTRIAGEAVYEKAKALLQSLKDRWLGNPHASETLANFEAKPEEHQAEMVDVLQTTMTADPAMAADVSQRMEDLGPVLVILQDVTGGENTTGAEIDEATEGRIAVTQKIKDAKGTKGAVIKKFGR